MPPYLSSFEYFDLWSFRFLQKNQAEIRYFQLGFRKLSSVFIAVNYNPDFVLSQGLHQ